MTTYVEDFDRGPGGWRRVANNFDPPQGYVEIDRVAIEFAS